MKTALSIINGVVNFAVFLFFVLVIYSIIQDIGKEKVTQCWTTTVEGHTFIHFKSGKAMTSIHHPDCEMRHVIFSGNVE